MAQPMSTVEVLQGFCSDDRWGPVNANKGDIITVSQPFAVHFIKKGWLKKYRPPKKREEK
jgi:hypothetical protein